MTNLTQEAIDNALAHAKGISQLMAALEVDFYQLEELTDSAANLRYDLDEVGTDLEGILNAIDAEADDAEREAQIDEHTRLHEQRDALTEQLADVEEELTELKGEAGEYTNRDEVESALYEYPLEVAVRSDWTPLGETPEASEYMILLTTGGPAARIRGELDVYGAPATAYMEASDWGMPWTEVHTGCSSALLEFAQFILPN